LGNLKLPSSLSEWFDFPSDVFDVPPSNSYEMMTFAPSDTVAAEGTAMVDTTPQKDKPLQ
jgi:hypothetical protein